MALTAGVGKLKRYTFLNLLLNITNCINCYTQHAPGVPKVLVGNRLHLEFKRAVSVAQAEAYAQRHGMAFFEISPLCNYNVAESLAELTRRALRRNGMERLWRTNRGLSFFSKQLFLDFAKILYLFSFVAARVVLPLNRLADLSLHHWSAPSATDASFAAAFVRPQQRLRPTPSSPPEPSPRNEDGHQKVKTQSCPRKTHLRHFMISSLFLFSICP